jgi:hypothetical protein
MKEIKILIDIMINFDPGMNKVSFIHFKIKFWEKNICGGYDQ